MTAALAGRRIDAPDTGVPRFPPEAADAVRGALRRCFERHGVTLLVCSGACGADLLALDVAGALGVRRRLVLPTAPGAFRAASVVDREDPAHDWGALFDRVRAEVERRGDLVVLDLDADDAGYAATTTFLLDEAGRLAAGADPLAVVVWDGASRGPGDLTASFADQARARGWPIAQILTRRP